MPDSQLLGQWAGFLHLITRAAFDTLTAMQSDPDIAGATDDGALTAVAGSLFKFHPGGRVLQLGTYIGWSTVVLGDICKYAQPTGHLVTVDPEGRVLDKAFNYARQAGVSENVTFVQGKSTDLITQAKIKRLAPYDVIYIDASHAYRETLQEIDTYLLTPGWLSDNAIVFFHDAGENARAFDPTGEGGVRRALEERFGPDTPERFEKFGLTISDADAQFPCGLATYVPRRL